MIAGGNFSLEACMFLVLTVDSSAKSIVRNGLSNTSTLWESLFQNK